MCKPFLTEALTSYLITSNTSERRYFLRPSQELCAAILYCIADAQARHPVHIHAFCAMSNHIHIVITDLDGTAPLFVQAMNQSIAWSSPGELPMKFAKRISTGSSTVRWVTSAPCGRAAPGPITAYSPRAAM